MLQSLLIVGVGSGIGGMLRHICTVLMTRYLPGEFPAGTFVVNLAGSFAIGYLAALPRDSGLTSPQAKLFLTTGLLGGFTTFSAFSVQSLVLLQNGRTGLGIIYIVASVVCCVLGAWLGILVGRN